MTVPDVPSLLDLTGRVAVVTGGSGGIGSAVARRLAAAGAAVLVHSRSRLEEAEAVVEEIRQAGGTAAAASGDLRRPERAAQVMSVAADEFGQVDFLVANAGVYPVSSLESMPLEEWQHVYESNVTAAFLSIQAVVAHMRRLGGGAIVTIGSVAATVPAPGQSHYGSAKAAVSALTRSAAQELADYRIRVNSVVPGLVRRPGIEQEWPDGVARWLDRAPLGRMGDPLDVADACLFLLSPASRWITGQELVVDGGVSVAPLY